MAFKFVDRVKDSTTTTGTGAVTLDGLPPTGFRSFASGLSVNDTTSYCIEDATSGAWEVGVGTLTAGTTLSRDTVLASSNANVLVSFAAGAKNVFITQPALDLLAESVSSVAPVGTVQRYSKSIANRAFLAQIGNTGIEKFSQPFLGRARIGYWAAQGNSGSAPTTIGMGTPTASIGTARSINQANIVSRMRRIGYATAATAGALANVYSGQQMICGNGVANEGSGFYYACKFAPANNAAVAGERFFCGISTSFSAPTNVEPSTLTNQIGVAQLSTDNTQFYLVYGGSAAQTAIPLGTNFPPATAALNAFEIAIYSPPSPANTYYVQVTNFNTNAVYTTTLTGASTVVPQSSSVLAWRIWKTNNATALAAAFDLATVYIETDI